MNTEPWFRSLLVCPDCRTELQDQDARYACAACGLEIEATAPVDLRPRNPQPLKMTFARRPSAYLASDLGDLRVERPKVTVSGPRTVRDSSELLSAMAPFLAPNAGVLDLGCGAREELESVRHQGWRYVGADYQGKAADVLADAHALPFCDGAFDAVLSYAVLEHLYHPYMAIHEVNRILKPGGVYCGTVSQGEPFHSSFFNMTAWGVVSLFECFELQVLRLWPNYDTLFALAEIGRYPRVIKGVLRLVAKIHDRCSFLAPRRMRWSPRQKQVDELYRAAAICFLAQKPG